ncbi:MAG TPA: S9 family peptidase [Candidatus Cryptobacteroides pullicola]|nr:S9 family peptidase [Candidatus Cryptobacteroides pullicola]
MLNCLIGLILGVLATHPEGNPGARMLTVEESVGQGVRSVLPERVSLYWTADGKLTKTPESSGTLYTLPESPGPGISYGGIVSRSEFGYRGGVFPSPDGSKIAVYRKDERAVGIFPMFDISLGDGSTVPLRYPMAGGASERLSLVVCDTLGNELCTLGVTDFDEERYLTGITWSPDGRYIFVQVLSRSQHDMNLNMYRSDDGSFVRTILSEHNDAWVEPQDPLYFIKGSYEFLYRTDNRDGYKNLYLCDTLGSVRRLTECDADVSYIADDGRYVYYTSAEVSPVENHLFRIRLRRSGHSKPERLTWEKGWHEIDMSPDCTKFIDRYSSFNVPGVTVVKDCEGNVVNHILTALDPLDEYAQCRAELGTVRSADGKYDNYYRLFYPLDYDPSKEYPLIVYVYGGPHSQMVTDSYLGNIRMWEMLMAQKGYFVYVQDNRGTQNRGAAFEKAINRQCGVAEAADQMAGINALLDRIPAIDRERIGVHGWSYGGFMTLTLACDNPGFFKVAVAGGPVIDWKWYEVMYGERYMDRPQDNPEGYALTSLVGKADNLTGRVLICQGVLDDTVVWEHSLSFLQACIREEKRIDYFPYPLEAHNMMGRARVHLYDKITDYFETYL